MTIREIIEARAREAATRISCDPNTLWSNSVLDGRSHNETVLANHLQSFAITILTDPQIGFKEALECELVIRDLHYEKAEFAAAEAKLAEIQELEAKK